MSPDEPGSVLDVGIHHGFATVHYFTVQPEMERDGASGRQAVLPSDAGALPLKVPLSYR